MADIELKSNEKKYIEFIIKDSDLERFNLTSIDATIQIQKYGESTLVITNTCEVTSAVDGECRWLYGGTLSTGDYKAEIELTTTGGLKYITPSFDIEVVSGLPEWLYS